MWFLLLSGASAFRSNPAVTRRGARLVVAPRHAILTLGEPVPWEDSIESLTYVREHGVKQFLSTWERTKNKRTEELLWGDEIEYTVLRLDDERAFVSLRCPEIRDELLQKEAEHTHRPEGCEWMPEYGAWMIEGTPRRPYAGYAADLTRVEINMRLRRRRLLSVLREDEICPTLVNFAGFGVGDFTWPPCHDTLGPVANSATVPDGAIHPHPRFATLTANIRKRRGENVLATPPRFFDVATPKNASLTIGGVDAMAYGMGCCCLQVTFQARDVSEARYIYDQLAALAPVMLALTAATPIWRGQLADTDARWDVVAASVDDRTRCERGVDEAAGHADARLAGGGVEPLQRSRYSSIAQYAFECDKGGQVRRFCDVDAPLDEAAYAELKAAGVDDSLSRHVASLFVRDPLVIFAGQISELEDATHSDHFDNLQSTNWNTVRLKPPPIPKAGHSEDSTPGWRTEFRPMEVQMTDFENAAFSVFSVLVTRVVLAFDLSLYVPLSRVDANMKRAQRKDAATKEKFFFRKNMAYNAPNSGNSGQDFATCCESDAGTEEFEEMTCAEIMDGKGDYFPGLAPLVYAYLEHIGCDSASLSRVSQYIELVRARARGEVLTPAKWIREYVTQHPDYARDGLVGPRIARDLSVAAHEIGIGTRTCPELLGDVVVRPVTTDGAWDQKLTGVKMDRDAKREALLQIYANRNPKF